MTPAYLDQTGSARFMKNLWMYYCVIHTATGIFQGICGYSAVYIDTMKAMPHNNTSS